MRTHNTELASLYSAQLDQKPAQEALVVLLNGQYKSIDAVKTVLPSIDVCAQMMAHTIQNNGCLLYVGAGSSGLMAMADAFELPGTFGIPLHSIRVVCAGGTPNLACYVGDCEDNIESAIVDVQRVQPTKQDCGIFLSASGHTPYTIAALEETTRAGAKTIAIVNNHDTPLARKADRSLVIATPPEVVAGSTRLGAATAQKVVLNTMSTLMAIHLGHIYDGYMINFRADNAKLRKRAQRTVSKICGCNVDKAQFFLDKANGSVKAAILLAHGLRTTTQAHDILRQCNGSVRRALIASQKHSAHNND